MKRKRTRKNNSYKHLQQVLPYFLVGFLTLLLVFLGSIDKKTSEVNLSLDSFAANDFNISVDQLSELYVVADLSDALGLASATDVASNYVITTTMYDSGQTSTAGKLEKPSLTNIAASRGVVEYTVKEGENIDTIASKYGVSSDQLRWSNNLKTTEVAAGTLLYIPSTPGIVYTVKSDDTVESIIALNDLEVSGLSEGAKIIIKDGSLPETERPEYVPPVVTRPTYTNTYTYLGNTSERQNIQVVGYYSIGYGQCVDWASHMRPDLVALGVMGNANYWDDSARNHGVLVDHTPSAGAIFQTDSGWVGHVGYVESVNSDGSIVVTEMNYGYVPGRVIRATIPAGYVGNFNYIH